MPRNDYLDQLRRRLLELGCPVTRMRRLSREVADHREDLMSAARAEGLAEVGAEVRADVQLGDPLALAENLMAAQRRSSWWGRHYVVTFGLLPVLAYPILWALFLFLGVLLELTLGFGWHWKRLHTAVDNPATFQYLHIIFQFIDYMAMTLATLLFCWLARRAGVTFKWLLIACLICSLLAVIFWAKIEPHSFFVGFSANLRLDMPWIRGVVPLLVAAATQALQQRRARRYVEEMTA